MGSIRCMAVLVLALSSCRKEQAAPLDAGVVKAEPLDAGVVKAAPLSPTRAGLSLDVTRTELGQWARELKAQTGPAYRVRGHVYCVGGGPTGSASECQVELGGVVRSFSNVARFVEAVKSDSPAFAVFGEFQITSIASEFGAGSGSEKTTLKTLDVSGWERLLKRIDARKRAALEPAGQAPEKLQGPEPRFQELVESPLELTSEHLLKITGGPECVVEVTGLVPHRTVHLWLRQSTRFASDFKAACVEGQPCPALACPKNLDLALRLSVGPSQVEFRMLDTPVGLKVFRQLYQSSDDTNEHLMGMLFIEGQELGVVPVP